MQRRSPDVFLIGNFIGKLNRPGRHTVHQNFRCQRARQATRAEAAELWPRLFETYPPFQTYVSRTDRELPVMILEPR